MQLIPLSPCPLRVNVGSLLTRLRLNRMHKLDYHGLFLLGDSFVEHILSSLIHPLFARFADAVERLGAIKCWHKVI